MKERKIRWLMTVSAVFGFLWLVGLALTLGHYFSPDDPAPEAVPVAAAPVQTQPTSQPQAPAQQPQTPSTPAPAASSTPAPSAETYRVVALGDSLTKGTGDPQGAGYVGNLLESLKAKGKQQATADNYGVDGQTSVQLAARLQKADVQAKVKAANMIVVSIGANDLFQGGATLNNMSAQNIKSIQDEYAKQMDIILKEIRKQNAEANIFLIGLYNPFIALADNATTSKIVRDWNYRTGEIAAAYPKTVLVPTFDLFQLNVQAYLARDLFHPNGAGYRLIGDRVASLISM
jgi:lysophospholipase L1-like esterase